MEREAAGGAETSDLASPAPAADGAVVGGAAARSPLLPMAMAEASSFFRSPWMTLLFMAAALTVYVPRIVVPPRYIFDEVFHAYTAAEYVAGNPDAFILGTRASGPNVGYTWNHPPAGLWCLAGGTWLFGNTPFGWRIAAALFGALGVALTHRLALRLTGHQGIAALTATFLLLDGLWFVQSRTAMLDIFGAVFLLAAMLALLAYLRAPCDRVLSPLAVMGLFLGLGVATKWNGAFPATAAAVVVAAKAVAIARRARSGAADATVARAALRAHAMAVPLSLIVIPGAVYLAAYLPFFLVGHSFTEFVHQQWQMWSFHAHLGTTHAYQSRWWQWPLALHPVWYAVDRLPGTIANTYANGNPLLFWAFQPAIGWVLGRQVRQRNPGAAVVGIGFLGSWLPWALVSRSSFMYHFLPAVPFGALAVAWVTWRVAGRGGVWRALACAYAALVAAAFVYFYPIWSSLPLSYAGFAARLWFASWR